MVTLKRDLRRARNLMKAVAQCCGLVKVKPAAVADLSRVPLEDLLLARQVVLDFLTSDDAEYLPSVPTIAAVYAAHCFAPIPDGEAHVPICTRADGAQLVLLCDEGPQT